MADTAIRHKCIIKKKGSAYTKQRNDIPINVTCKNKLEKWKASNQVKESYRKRQTLMRANNKKLRPNKPV